VIKRSEWRHCDGGRQELEGDVVRKKHDHTHSERVETLESIHEHIETVSRGILPSRKMTGRMKLVARQN
jgi:hypothetical protein